MTRLVVCVALAACELDTPPAAPSTTTVILVLEGGELFIGDKESIHPDERWFTMGVTEELRAARNSLLDFDRVGLVTYDSEAHVVFAPSPAIQLPRDWFGGQKPFYNKIGTNLEAGLASAKELVVGKKDAAIVLIGTGCTTSELRPNLELPIGNPVYLIARSSYIQDPCDVRDARVYRLGGTIANALRMVSNDLRTRGTRKVRYGDETPR